MSVPTVGAQLRAARKFDRLTLREVAEKVGVGVPHLSKVENDQENPSDDLLYKLAEVYGLSGDLLVLYAGRVPPRFVAALVADPVRALDLLSTLPVASSTADALPQTEDCADDVCMRWKEGHDACEDGCFEAIYRAGLQAFSRPRVRKATAAVGGGGGLNVPSNFTDTPTPTPTDNVVTTLDLAITALRHVEAIARRLRDGWHVISTTVVDGTKHEWHRAVWDGPDETAPLTPAEWDAYRSLGESSVSAGPSPAGTPETEVRTHSVRRATRDSQPAWVCDGCGEHWHRLDVAAEVLERQLCGTPETDT